jgi:hypothetical protein
MGNIHGFVGHLFLPGQQAILAIGATLRGWLDGTLPRALT